MIYLSFILFFMNILIVMVDTTAVLHQLDRGAYGFSPTFFLTGIAKN